MAQVLISTAGSVNGETEASEQLKNRSLLFNAQSEVLKIKWNDELIPIAGAVKQGKLTAGDNIEINDETDEIRLADDIVIETMTLSPANTDIPNWKGTIKIGELTGGNCILLIIKESAGEQAENGIIGGEILIKSVEGDLVNYSQYVLTITSTGSWTLKGGSNSSEGAYVCKCLYNGEYYYGLKMPCLKKVVEQDTQIEVTKQREVQRFGSISLLRTNLYNGNFRLLATDNSSAYVDLTSTNLGSGYNRWYYCSLDTFQTMFGWSDSNKDWYGKDYYVYFYIYRRTGSTNDYSVRITQIALTDRVMNTAPSAGTEGVIFNSGINESDLFTDLNSDIITNTKNKYYSLQSDSVRLGSVIDSFIEYYTEIESGIEEVEQIIPPENSEVWFNGWKSIPESLTPPNGYTDSQIIYEILKQSSSGENFKDIIEIPVDSNISDIEQTIQNLSPTGEDGDAYKIKLSGTLTLTDLKAIAEVCKDPEKQIYLDLSECTVAEDAQTWNVGLFRSCVSLRGLSIPQGVRQIIGTEFLWCTYLRVLDLSPSAGTLYELGASSNWGTIMSLLSSTRIRLLIVPNSVTRLTNYFMGASNIKKLVFTHQDYESLSISDWTFQVHDSGGNLISTIPTGFHLYVTESWWNNYLYNNFIKDGASQKWQWSSTTYWTKEVVDSIVTYDPNWSKEQWQAFATEYDWTEEEVNYVRRYFGLSDLDLKQA